MNVLGLHFGHDAAVALLCDGRLASYVLRERHCRTKHAIGLQWENIARCLAAAGCSIDDVDACAITSTQDMELIIDDGERFGVSMRRHERDVAPAPLAELFARQNLRPESLLRRSLLPLLYGEEDHESIQYRCYRHCYPELATRAKERTASFGWLDNYIACAAWNELTIERLAGSSFDEVLAAEEMRLGFHFPLTVRLGERQVPGYFVHHHAAHAAGVYYQSPFERAAILTHDGHSDGKSDLAGLCFYGEGDRITAFAAHHLALGVLYDTIGLFLKLGEVGPAGKLMGLAAWGHPRFFEHAFVGNQLDWEQRGQSIARWAGHCLHQAEQMGYDRSALGEKNRMTEAINVDIAASTQKLFEETLLASVEAAHSALRNSHRCVKNLCLSGGTALNCPANGRIHREGPFENLYIEPGCDDGGLAVGAAKWICHNVMSHPRRAAESLRAPYLGPEVPERDVEGAIAEAGDSVRVERPPDAAARAADDLASDRVIAWFEGRSEIGPRALGHRSILADARYKENWQRVNELKGREWWRPLAPAVLEEDAPGLFRGTPSPSPFMLFTGYVTTNQLPAVTHVDGSSRIQTVSEACGQFARILRAFKARTGIGAVLNTSFNGPGEPIVETPAHAIRFLQSTPIDALYLAGRRLSRATVA